MTISKAEQVEYEMKVMMQIIDKSVEIAEILSKGNSLVIKATSEGGIKCYEQEWRRV